jgi:hypothetical protein
MATLVPAFGEGWVVMKDHMSSIAEATPTAKAFTRLWKQRVAA